MSAQPSHSALLTAETQSRALTPAFATAEDPGRALAKQSLARELTALGALLHNHADRRSAYRCDALLEKLAADRFTLVVVGQFKRGKSSLMNALVGREVLPTGVLPLTSVITVLRFGPSPRLLIQHENGAGLEERPLQSLADFVTESGNPGNHKRVQTAYIELPAACLRQGLEFVDTPGVGSAIEANTRTTCDFVPHCDAVVFVTSVDSPLTTTESQFLRSIRQTVPKLFVVVNKTDLVGPPETAQVVDFISARLRDLPGTDAVRIFPVSSIAGLRARMAADDRAYAATGLPALEQALAEFLTQERSTTLFASLAGQAQALIDSESQRLTRRIEYQTRASDSLSDRERRVRSKSAELKAQRLLRQQLLLQDLPARVRAWASTAFDAYWNDKETKILASIKRRVSSLTWRPARFAVHHVSRAVRQELHEDPDWSAHVPALEAQIRQTLQSQWEALTGPLAELPPLAADWAQPPADALPTAAPAPLPPRIDADALKMNEPEWTPYLQGMAGWLPSLLLRQRLQPLLLAEVPRLRHNVWAALVQKLQPMIAAATDHLIQQAERHADALERRLLSALDKARAAIQAECQNVDDVVRQLAACRRRLDAVIANFCDNGSRTRDAIDL